MFYFFFELTNILVIIQDVYFCGLVVFMFCDPFMKTIHTVHFPTVELINYVSTCRYITPLSFSESKLQSEGYYI